MEALNMNKNDFKGFDNIKPSKALLDKTKTKILHTSTNKEVISMKKHKKILWAVPALTACLILVFTISHFTHNQSIMITANASDLMTNITPNKVDTSSGLTDKFINSTLDFSLDLFKNSISDNKNSLISPASVSIALGLAANGADKDTLKEFENVLGRYDLNIDDLNKGYSQYMKELLKPRGNTKFTISNSIWYRNEFSPATDFLQTNADYFGAGAHKIDFNDKAAPSAINSWVKSNTNNMIDKLITDIPKDTVMFLINTLYFDAKWETPFITSSPSKFTTQDGKSVDTKFMELQSKLPYTKNSNSESVLLPYDDSRFAFLATLPNKNVNLTDCINSLDGDYFKAAINAANNTTDLEIRMPKFSSDYSIELKDSLKAIGLDLPFAEGKADLSKMQSSHEANLYISSVLHKTNIKVNELGTKAAAATKVEIMAESAVEGVRTLNFNRPFIYSIIDTQTGLPIFIGTFERP